MEDALRIYSDSMCPFIKRAEKLFSIVQNKVYYEDYTLEERIFASKIITRILEEELTEHK